MLLDIVATARGELRVKEFPSPSARAPAWRASSIQWWHWISWVWCWQS
jgi:hypothetical protein